MKKLNKFKLATFRSHCTPRNILFIYLITFLSGNLPLPLTEYSFSCISVQNCYI